MSFPTLVESRASIPAREWEKYLKNQGPGKIKERLNKTRQQREADAKRTGQSLKELYYQEEDRLRLPPPRGIRVDQSVSVSYSSTMNKENRPPTISVIPATPVHTPAKGTGLEVIKETISPVHSSMLGEENSQAKIRTQVLRGSDHITGLARHQFKRDGEFGDPPPNPIGVSMTPLETAPANTRTTELDTNICKAGWLKSTIDWPFPHLFDSFREGFGDVRYAQPDQDRINKTKGTNFIEDCNISEEKWSARAYAEGVKFGKKYIADRPSANQTTVMEQFDYINDGPVLDMEHPSGGFESYMKRVNNEEAERRKIKKKQEAIQMWKDMAECKCCNLT
ncbi:hypothetical protein H072_7412 [Dactylellina haptotyla CBS 200.50]|uniref:Uncharacterized protein n=1 Tax=Dactylellina haptotyla (strain CBS 200.50) TaxID=1284197 RepID=S8BU49_DACHA|nr:hypothetical protein H072_7412 [Dactylellina haptotyla CBS 200.50]